MIARRWLAAATASLAANLSAGCATTPQPIRITDIVLTSYTEAAQRTHPEYFADLPALPR